MIRWLLSCLIAPLLLLCLMDPAAAQTCTARVTDFNFGTVSLRAGAVNQTSGSVTVDCRGGLLGGVAQPVGVCLTFGGGSVSDGGTPPRRFMQGPGGALLEYQLRNQTGAALHQIFLSVLVVAGRGSATAPIDAAIIGGNSGLPTGAYQASYSGAGATGVGMKTGVLLCDLLGTQQPVEGFGVSATAASSCEIETSVLDFGNIGSIISAPIDQSATIEVRCTDGTPYRVSLGMGSGPGTTGPTNRQMRNLLSTLTYGLFQDAARATPWGDTLASNVPGQGSGAAQIFRVFGRIFPGQQVPPGAYTDNVVVTIAY